jgi:hypothetical protein
MHHPKNVILGFHGWDETIPQGLVYLVNSWFFFFILFLGGVHCFFSWAPFLLLFFLSPPLTPYFIWNSYLPLQPTYHPSSYQPIYLRHFAHPQFVLVFHTIANGWKPMGPRFRVIGLWVSRAWKEWGERRGGVCSNVDVGGTL